MVELQFLSEDPGSQAVCSAYWAVDPDGSYRHSVAELTSHFELTQAELYRILSAACSATVKGTECPICGRPAVVKNRTALTGLLKRPPTTCVECLRQARQVEFESAQDLEARRRSIVAATYSVVEGAAIDLAFRSARVVIGLAALLRTDTIDRGIIGSLEEREDTLMRGAPTASSDLISELHHEGLIRVHPSSPPSAFVWTEEEEPTRFYIARARYYLVGSGDLEGRLKLALSEIEDLLIGLKECDWESLLELWLEASSAECEEYLLFHLNDRGLSFSPGVKTRQVIREGLRYLSLGQMFALIWRSAAQADNNWHRNNISGKQAANSAITYLEAQVSRVLSEDKIVEPYRLDSRIGLAAFSKILFVEAMGMRDVVGEHPLLQVDRTAKPLNWKAIKADAFENLIFLLMQQAEGYSNVAWLMHTNAPDHGRDISAVRTRHDPLSGVIRERLIVQCKHYSDGSVTDTEIGNGLISIEHWDSPPIDVFVVVTCGKYTANAVSYVESHNNRGRRPRIEIWNDAHLEVLLAGYPGLRDAFNL